MMLISLFMRLSTLRTIEVTGTAVTGESPALDVQNRVFRFAPQRSASRNFLPADSLLVYFCFRVFHSVPKQIV